MFEKLTDTEVRILRDKMAEASRYARREFYRAVSVWLKANDYNLILKAQSCARGHQGIIEDATGIIRDLECLIS
jgi:hypothetical protein